MNPRRKGGAVECTGPDSDVCLTPSTMSGMSAPGIKRYEVFYAGRVQGVGFRANARHLARRFAVTGFVRNLPDGRVQLVAEGEAAEIERLLEAIDESMAGNIVSAPRMVLPATGEFAAFSIT